ncbi:MAG TPA: prenyltransferase/squalene oxidase repeat-containing protein, partial [Isosphaeraceae bacterium]|nr:prenyltransferase/squalene oxidase repeat-containing protein [Isosphaeraceae bacterium]
MRRFQIPLILVGLLTFSATAPAQTHEQMEKTAYYAASLQNPDGGFAGQPGGESTLGGTSSAIRILKYNGGSIPDVLGAIDYVKSCFDPETGGFAPEPGGKPDAHTTSVGLMAASELKVADPEMVKKAVNYLAEHAEGFPEVRLAVAGLEAVKAPCPVEEKWLQIINEGRNDDGTWGSGESKAFETGGHAVAL